MRLALATFVAGLLLSAGSAHAERPALALVVGDQVNVSLDQAYAWADELGRAIGERDDVHVLPSSVVRLKASAEGFGPRCLIDRRCLSSLAKQLGATELMILHIVRVAGQVQVDTTWIDMSSQNAAVRSSISFTDAPKHSRVAFRLHARSVRPQLLRSSTPGSDSELAKEEDAPEEEINLGVWLAGGVSGALFAGALAYTFAAFSADEEVSQCAAELESRPTTSQCLGQKDFFELRERRDHRAFVADMLWLSAGVAATSAVLFAVLQSDNDKPISVGAGPSGASVNWTMRF